MHWCIDERTLQIHFQHFRRRSIDLEANAKGDVILKLNHLTDDAVLDSLERAANAGARVDLFVQR